MRLTLEQVSAETRLGRKELVAWVEQRWVKPGMSDAGYVFDEVDIARVRLIRELRRDLRLNRESIPVVLTLMDQLYEMRRALSGLGSALKELPPETRADIVERLRR